MECNCSCGKKQVCPICGGRGFVALGFYTQYSIMDNLYQNTYTTSLGPPITPCKACGGKGVV